MSDTRRANRNMTLKLLAFAAGAFEITDVADVQHIKAAVGENDASSVLLVLR